ESQSARNGALAVEANGKLATMEHSTPRNNVLPFENWNLLRKDFREAAPTAARGKILIEGASDASRSAAREALGPIDQELIETRSTSEAVAAISLNRVDLVLADLLVPELGGTEFCRMLKKATATQFLPVFLIAPADDLD